MVSRYIRGETKAAIAGDLGVSPTTVSNVLAAAGVTRDHRTAVGARSGPGGFSGPAVQSPPPRPELRQQFADLGDPPADPVAAGEWLYRNLMLAARQVATDPNLDSQPAERNKSLVAIARAAAGCLPAATLSRTVDLIRRDAEERDGPGAGPEEEPRPIASDPSRAHRAPPIRGRPRNGA